jgi:hypothetical protein
MSSADPYERWRNRRSDVEVDEQFADWVMEALRAPADERPGAVPPAPGVLRVASRFAATAALVAATIFIGLLRLESVAALILLLSSEGF